MDDPNITMAEYIQLEEEKARRRGQELNWETATYGKVRYFEDIDYFKDFENQFSAIVYNDALTSEREILSDFENEFPAIVYNDALTSEPEVSSEPTVIAYPAIKINFDFKISSSDSDDEDYTFIYDKNSFSYKLVSIYDLKSDSNNDDDKIDIKQSSGDLSISPLPNVQFIRTSLTGFPAQSIRTSNAIALDSPYLLVLITETSQSRQHESRKSPTKSLFDVVSRRISIVTVNTKEYHSDVLEIITRIMRRTY
ncbi:hypothetical protein Tco_1189582 [Tanacetum coccineum]